MSSDESDRDRNEDLSELLDDLGATLAELRSELRQGERPDSHRDTTARRTRRDRPEPDTGLPRPPSVSDLLGFTEQYTLPTLISTLEATIRALELLRGSLRLVNPDRSGFEAPSDRQDRSPASRLGTGAAGVGREAVSGVERALSELETAVAESDVPRDRASSELLGEARDLSAEVRARLETAQGAGDTGRGRRQEGDGSERRDPPEPDPGADGVAIEVTDGSDGGDPDGTGDGTEDDPRPEVDVEAELASIRQEVNGTGDADPVDARAGDEEHGGDSDGDDDVTVDGSERGNDDAGSTADSGDGGADGAGSGDSPRD